MLTMLNESSKQKAPAVSGASSAGNHGEVDLSGQPNYTALESIAQESVIQKQPGANIPALSLVNIPDLPKAARLSDAEIQIAASAGEWIGAYASFAQEAFPMTPPEHHRFYGYILAATAIARRVVWRISAESIYPNLYGLLIAPSGDSKTGGARLASKMLRAARLHPLTLPGYMSPQGLMQELIGKQDAILPNMYTEEIRDAMQIKAAFPAQRILMLDEASILFAWFGQAHMEGMKQFVLRLYDCPDEESETTAGRGNGIAKNIYFNLCGISTPTDMNPFFKSAAHWGNGIWSRFAFVTPTWDKPPYHCFPPALDIPAELPAHLKKLFAKLGVPKGDKPIAGKSIIVPQKVFDRWKLYDRAVRYDMVYSDQLSNRYKSNYKRFPMLAMKHAMIAASLDWVNSKESAPRVELKHLYAGMIEAELYRASLHRLIEVPNTDGQEETLESKVLRLLPEFSSGMVATEREIAQAVNMSGHDDRWKVTETLSQMVKDGIAVKKSVVRNVQRKNKVEGFSKA